MTFLESHALTFSHCPLFGTLPGGLQAVFHATSLAGSRNDVGAATPSLHEQLHRDWQRHAESKHLTIFVFLYFNYVERRQRRRVWISTHAQPKILQLDNDDNVAVEVGSRRQ